MANLEPDLWGCEPRNRCFFQSFAVMESKVVFAMDCWCNCLHMLWCAKFWFIWVLFIGMSVFPLHAACLFPLQRRLRTCRMVRKFCFPAADAIKPITKLVEICWNRSSRGNKISKQQVRSEDSGLCCCNDQQRLPQVGRWQQDLQGTVSKISATEWVKLPPCRCKRSVVMLAIDLSNSAF